MWRFEALCEWSCLSVYVCVLCTSVYQHCVCVFICTYFRLWQLKKETYSSRRDGSLESDGGRAGLLHTHDLSAQNKALCSPPCERACQRKAEGLPLSASPSQRKHKSSAGSLTERDNLINHAAVRTPERRPVKASLTALIGEAVEKGRLWLYFSLPKNPQTPSHFLYFFKFKAFSSYSLNHLEVSGTVKQDQFLDLEHPSVRVKEQLECPWTSHLFLMRIISEFWSGALGLFTPAY